MISQTKKRQQQKKSTYFAGHVDDHADQAVQSQAHRQYGRSRAILDATGRRNQVSIRPVSSQQTRWSSILAYKIELWRCGNCFSKLCTSLLGLLCFTSFHLAILNTKDQTLGNKCINNNPPPPALLLWLTPTYCVMATPFDQLPQHTVRLRRVTRFGRAGRQ